MRLNMAPEARKAGIRAKKMKMFNFLNKNFWFENEIKLLKMDILILSVYLGCYGLSLV